MDARTTLLLNGRRGGYAGKTKKLWFLANGPADEKPLPAGWEINWKTRKTVTDWFRSYRAHDKWGNLTLTRYLPLPFVVLDNETRLEPSDPGYNSKMRGYRYGWFVRSLEPMGEIPKKVRILPGSEHVNLGGPGIYANVYSPNMYRVQVQTLSQGEQPEVPAHKGKPPKRASLPPSRAALPPPRRASRLPKQGHVPVQQGPFAGERYMGARRGGRQPGQSSLVCEHVESGGLDFICCGEGGTGDACWQLPPLRGKRRGSFAGDHILTYPTKQARSTSGRSAGATPSRGVGRR